MSARKLLSLIAFACMAVVVRCAAYPKLELLNSFRYDYNYFNIADGWFKLHRVPRTFEEARHRCLLEGTDLASPTSGEMVRAMAAALTSSPPWDGVYIGVHATFATGEYQHNGIPLERMPVEWLPSGALSPRNRDCVVFHHNTSISNENCQRELPFLCFKKEAEYLVRNACGTANNKYKFKYQTGSCYKFHNRGQNWTRAVMTCAAEGGYLAVINSAQEMNLLHTIFQSVPAPDIKADLTTSMFIGFTDLKKNREWITVLGKPLVETFESWATGEPDNGNNVEYCGSLGLTTEMNDAACGSILPFICEKDPKSLDRAPEK